MSNKASDNLHRLIKSLSKAEKRYFKVFSSRHVIGDKNNYQVLFDAIDKQDEYDEPALMKKFKNKSLIHRFSISKNRLYAAILKSLDSFHSNSSSEAQLHRQLHWVEILYQKSLYDQGLKQLHSAKKLAEKHEKYTILAEIAKWEKLLIEKDNYESLDAKGIQDLHRQDIVLSHHMSTYNELWNIKSHIFLMLYTQGKVRSEDELKKYLSIMDGLAAGVNSGKASSENIYLLNHIYSAYHFGLGEYPECYPYLLKNLKLIESKPHLFDEEPNIYLSVLTNAIYVGMRLNKWDESQKYLDKLRKLPLKLQGRVNEDLEIRMFTIIKSTELTLYTQSGLFEEGLKIIPEIEEGLFKYEDHISSVRKAHFFFNIAVIYFGLEKYHEALKWINQLLNNVEIDKSRDIHCMAQILNMVIHLELGNKSLLPFALRSAQRFLETRKKVYRFETIMLQFINEVLKKREKPNTDLYHELSEKLLELKTDAFERRVYEYFDFLAWAKSKTNQSLFKDEIGK
ncbi:MAG: hypothetical protein SGI87_09730 [Flavobacteriales bacterium]|nr:hypothetical protein [Flavobacteriales bacterium]